MLNMFRHTCLNVQHMLNTHAFFKCKSIYYSINTFYWSAVYRYANHSYYLKHDVGIFLAFIGNLGMAFEQISVNIYSKRTECFLSL